MVIRQEESSDWREVETLTREAFWNVYRPGCTEHLVLHNFRSDSAFVKELDMVIEDEGKIVAHIMYCKTVIETDAGKQKEILMFGPISVLPEVQHKGYGSRLIEYTMQKAAQLGYGAVAITGNPDYYHRFGFRSGSDIKVYYPGILRAEEAPFFMIKELTVGYLSGIKGTLVGPSAYTVSQEEVDEFDAQFPPKKKEKRPGQLA
jgi:predicted N-acetyltransferase YhbS